MQTELKKDIRLPFFLVSVFEKCDRAAGCHGTVTWLPSAHLSISLPRLVSVHRSFSLSWKVSLLLLPLFCTNYWINKKAYYAIARKVKFFCKVDFSQRPFRELQRTVQFSTFSFWCREACDAISLSVAFCIIQSWIWSSYWISRPQIFTIWNAALSKKAVFITTCVHNWCNGIFYTRFAHAKENIFQAKIKHKNYSARVPRSADIPWHPLLRLERY